MWRRLERQQIRDLERRWTVMKKVTALLLSLFPGLWHEYNGLGG